MELYGKVIPKRRKGTSFESGNEKCSFSTGTAYGQGETLNVEGGKARF